MVPENFQRNEIYLLQLIFIPLTGTSDVLSLCGVLRITSTVACDMDLTKYPMDEQECMLDLESCELENLSSSTPVRSNCRYLLQTITATDRTGYSIRCLFCSSVLEGVYNMCLLVVLTDTMILFGHRRVFLGGHRLPLVRESETHPRAGQTGALPVHHHRLSLCH